MPAHVKEALEKIAFWLAAFLFVASIAGYFLARPFELTSAAFGDRVGHTDVGDRLGLRIGMTEADAESVLFRDGMRHLITTNSPLIPGCNGRRRRNDESIDSWKDESWRNGTICLFLNRDGNVTGIAWYFGPADPPEF